MLKHAKRLLILLGALGVLAAALIYFAPSFISTEAVLASLRQGMDQAGVTLETTAIPRIEVGASVRLSIDGVTLKPKDAAQGWQASVKRLELDLPLTAIVSLPTPSAVALQGVDARLTQAETGGEPIPLQIVAGLAHLGRPGFDLSLREGTLRQGLAADAPVVIEKIDGEWTGKGEGAQLNVAGQYHGQSMTLKASVEDSGGPQRTISYQFDIPGLAFGFQGTRSAEATPLLQGTLALTSDDAAKVKRFFSPPPAAEAEAQGMPPEQAAAAPAPAAAPNAASAIKFSGKLFYQGARFVLKEIDAAAPGLQAKGELGGEMNAPYNIQAKLQFPLLDTEALETAGGMTAGGWLPSLLAGGLEAKASAKMLLEAEQVQGLVKGRQFVSLIEMKDGSAQVQQTRMQVAGDTALGFEGAINLTPQGPTLIGHLSAEGKSFRAFLPAVTPMPMSLPEQGFEAFALAGDLRFSAEDLRLSELRAKIGRSAWNAAFINQFASHEVGLRVAVSDLDLDALFGMQASGDGMRVLQKRGEGQVVQARLLPPYLQEKLLALRANYNLYLYLENYTLDGMVREPLELRAKIGRGRFDLDQLTTKVAGADIRIEGSLDVNSSVPQLSLDAKLGDFDLGRIQKWFDPASVQETPKTGDASPESPQGTRWSNAPLNWHFVPLADGTINLTADRILHPLATATNATVKAHLSNEQLVVDEVNAKLFNADLRAKGQISTGALPTWQASFTLANLEIAELGRILPYMRDIQGRISFSGAAATNGISQLSQIRNMRGSLAMAGRAVQLNQFDLSGMVERVRMLKSVDNLKNEIDQTLPLGNTRFDSLEGTITLDAGKIAIPRILMRNPRFVGILDGEGSLLDWTLNARTIFPLSVIRAQEPPQLIIRAQGPLDAVATERDERDLEKYVTGKTANELIQGR